MLRTFCQHRLGLVANPVSKIRQPTPLTTTFRRLHQERRKLNDLLFRQLEQEEHTSRNVVAHARNRPRSDVTEETSDNPFIRLGLDDRVTTRLSEMGIEAPTPVQEGSIPHVLSGDNVAIQCYTGSGKTLAYLLPVLALAVQRAEEELIAARQSKKLHSVGQIQAVVVAPSRELAMQILRVAQRVLPAGAQKAVQQCIGGANPARQAEALKFHKPLVVVGTPGRLAELNREGVLQTHHCPLLVLDEVDQLLAPHFREEMVRLTEHTGKKLEAGRQTIIVSATLTQTVVQLCSAWCPRPQEVFIGAHPAANRRADSSVPLPGVLTVGTPSWGWDDARRQDEAVRGSAGGVGTSSDALSLPPGLRHVHVSTSQRHKVNTLRRAIHALDVKKALVFMNHQSRLKDVMYKLEARKMEVGVLHGEMSKMARRAVLEEFKQGVYRALLVSDVMARGLDIPDCDAVFHLELPSDAAHYTHRAGRTGRMGRSGVVVSVVEPHEKFVIQKLSKRLQLDIPEVKLTHGQAMELDDDDFDTQDSTAGYPSSTLNRKSGTAARALKGSHGNAKGGTSSRKDGKEGAGKLEDIDTQEEGRGGTDDQKSARKSNWRERKLPSRSSGGSAPRRMASTW